MSEYDVTVIPTQWPQQRTGQDGTTYWIDSGGQVFSPALHIGPEDDEFGVDANGRWVPRPQERTKRRGWTKGKPRGPRRTAQEPAQAPIVPDPMPRHVPDVVWVVWHAERGQLETVGAFADPVEALTTLLDLPGGRVSRALVQ